MTHHWWEPDTTQEDAEANVPWWAALEPKTVPCAYCLGSLTCPLCDKNATRGCRQCGFTNRCPLCRGKGEIPNPD